MAEIKSVKGLIIPSAWDKEGKVTSVMIAAFDENEYFIEEGLWSKALLGLIHREVEVVGRVKTLGDRKFRIQLDNVEVNSLKNVGADSA